MNDHTDSIANMSPLRGFTDSLLSNFYQYIVPNRTLNLPKLRRSQISVAPCKQNIDKFRRNDIFANDFQYGTPLLFKGITLLVLLFFSFQSFSQQEKKLIRDGNKEYKKGNFNEAENDYLKAIEKNKNNNKAIFNLGDAYYKQEKYNEAAQQFEILTNKKMNKDSLAMAYHNLGNSLLKTKKYEDAVKAYKNALKNNPNDEDTRYNLAYAQSMLKKEQQQQKQDKKDDKKDEKKDEKKDQQQKEDEKKKEDKQKQKQTQPKEQISKQEAEKDFRELNNQEKNIQAKLKKQKAKVNAVKIEKDW